MCCRFQLGEAKLTSSETGFTIRFQNRDSSESCWLQGGGKNRKRYWSCSGQRQNVSADFLPALMGAGTGDDCDARISLRSSVTPHLTPPAITSAFCFLIPPPPPPTHLSLWISLLVSARVSLSVLILSLCSSLSVSVCVHVQLSLCLSVCLFSLRRCLSACLSVCLSVSVSVCLSLLSLPLFVCLLACLCLCLSVSVSLCVSVSLSNSLCLCLSVFLFSLCVSLCVSPSLSLSLSAPSLCLCLSRALSLCLFPGGWGWITHCTSFLSFARQRHRNVNGSNSLTCFHDVIRPADFAPNYAPLLPSLFFGQDFSQCLFALPDS